MLIKYDVKDGEHITHCPLKHYDDLQLAFVGDEHCRSCAFNMDIYIQEVDCSFMDCSEERKQFIGKMFSEDGE